MSRTAAVRQPTSGKGPLGVGIVGIAAVVFLIVGIIAAQVQKQEQERTWRVESGAHTIQLTGRLVIDGRWALAEQAVLTTDARWETTTLRITITKLDNAIDSDAVIQVDLGNATCVTHRPFAVYQSGGGNLFEGDVGYQDLRCSRFIPLSGLTRIASGAVEGA